MQTQRGSRDIVLLGDRQRRVVNAMVWSLDPRRDSEPIVQNDGWAPGPVQLY